MGELPVFTCQAHVFTINPSTRKSWVPASSKAIDINFFYDSNRQCYRIVSVEDSSLGKRVVINCTITEKMVFKQTSQKFGQWSDSKSGGVFGLGFNSEADLIKFVSQFKQCVETTKQNNSGTAKRTIKPLSSAQAQIRRLEQELSATRRQASFSIGNEELFFEHKWHTFLHASLEYLVRLIVNRASALTTEDYSRSDFLSSSSALPNGTLSASEACTLKSPECRKRDSGSPTPSSEISTGGLCNGHCEADTSTDAGAVFCEPFPRLLHQLLVEYKFLDRLMKVWDENENLRGKPKVRRAGYMGHLRSIANSLNDFLPPSALARPVIPSNGTAGASGQDGAPVPQTATGDCAPERSPPTPARPASADAADRSTSESQLGEVLFAMIPLDVRMRWGEFVQGDLARSNNAAFIDYANFPNSSSSSSVSTDDEVSRYKISDDAISAALQNAYQHYCSNQSLSASFPDLFGYAEDEFDDCRERLDVVIEQALSGLNFNLTIQEDTVNNSLFEQACNELVIAEGGEEVGDESVGLPIVCMETTTPTQPRLSTRSTAEASASPNVDGDRQRSGKEASSPILCRQPLGKTSLAQSLPTAAEVSQAPTEGHLKQLSLGRLKEVFSTPTINTEQPQENSSAPTTEEDEQDRSYGHLREASRRGDEALPDFASSSSSVATAPTIAVTPSRLSLPGRTPHLDPHAERHAPDSFVSSPPLSPSPTKELHPRLALAPGPTPSNGQPIMSVGRARRLSASPTADLPPWIDMFDDSESPMMRGSLNAANEASADALADTTADSVPPLRYTSRKYTWSAPPSPVRGPRSSTAPVKETRTDLQHVVSSELPDADSFILPRVPLLASDLNSHSSASSSSNSVKPDPARSPVSVAVCSSTSDPISAAPTTATSALFVTYDQAPVFALPSYSIPRPIQPTVRSHRLTRISLPNGRRMVGPGDEAVDPAAATAVLETTNSASPTSFRAAINTPEMVMQILNGTVPDSSPAGRRLPASSSSSSVFEDRSRVKRRVGRLTDGGEEVEEVGCYSPHRGGALFGRPALSAAVSNGSLELPQGVLLSRRPPPFVISESEFDEEEADEEDVDGEGYPVEEQLLTPNRFRTHTTLNLKKNAHDVETL
nr:unnamed protein product [Spirometra erinaceieuropaei]